MFNQTFFSNMATQNLLGKGNSKLNKTAKKYNARFFNFSIPAYKSVTGKITCPFAKDCVKFCYAQKGAYAWSNTQAALERRFAASQTPEFADQIVDELSKVRDDGRQIYVRIHDSGDFYSPEYRDKWIEIANRLPHVRFYAYTKSFTLFTDIDLPENMDIIFSQGSKLDQKTDLTAYRHAKIFYDVEQLEQEGYVDTTEYDLHATKWYNESGKVGLVFH